MLRAKHMDFDSRAIDWHARFDEASRMLKKVGRIGKDTLMAKFQCEHLVSLEETSWNNYFNQGNWFLTDYVTKKTEHYRLFMPRDHLSARDQQDRLALELHRMQSLENFDEEIFFCYTSLGISKELADARHPYTRDIERGLYVCFQDDLLTIPRDPKDRGMFIKQF
jgi:hypothetical protein